MKSCSYSNSGLVHAQKCPSWLLSKLWNGVGQGELSSVKFSPEKKANKQKTASSLIRSKFFCRWTATRLRQSLNSNCSPTLRSVLLFSMDLVMAISTRLPRHWAAWLVALSSDTDSYRKKTRFRYANKGGGKKEGRRNRACRLTQFSSSFSQTPTIKKN